MQNKSSKYAPAARKRVTSLPSLPFGVTHIMTPNTVTSERTRPPLMPPRPVRHPLPRPLPTSPGTSAASHSQGPIGGHTAVCDPPIHYPRSLPTARDRGRLGARCCGYGRQWSGGGVGGQGTVGCGGGAAESDGCDGWWVQVVDIGGQ